VQHLSLTIRTLPIRSPPSQHARSPSNGSDKAFVYPGSSEHDDEGGLQYPGASEDEEEEAFVYPGASTDSEVEPVAEPAPAPKAQPSPAQLEALYSSAASGDLPLLQKLFGKFMSEYDIQAFVLANDAGPRTGLTALHGASSRGHLRVVRWREFASLCAWFCCTHPCNSCGRVWCDVGLRGPRGRGMCLTLFHDCLQLTHNTKTALHKASLNGHLEIVKYLLSLDEGRADVHATDRDGWTALHNACSKVP